MATITLYGNLGTDAKQQADKNDKPFVSVNIAEQHSYLDKDTNKWIEVKTDWHNVIVFSPNVQGHVLNMRKGSRVKVEGQLSYRVAGKTPEGHDIMSTSIIAHRIESAPLIKNSEASNG